MKSTQLESMTSEVGKGTKMPTAKSKSHIIAFKQPIMNPLNGYMQKNIQVSDENYADLKKRANEAGLTPGRYVLWLLSNGISPFSKQAAKQAYVSGQIAELRKAARL